MATFLNAVLRMVTQALSTTDSSSVIAGFALRGTESCTKIINSESANAIASSNGVTIPYGIILQEAFDGSHSVVVEDLIVVQFTRSIGAQMVSMWLWVE